MKKIPIVRVRSSDPKDKLPPQFHVKATRNAHAKTITAIGAFCISRTLDWATVDWEPKEGKPVEGELVLRSISPVKLIASYRVWRDIEHAEGRISFAMFNRMLSRPRQAVRSLLLLYSKESPDSFRADIYRFARFANIEDPEMVQRPRRADHAFDSLEFHEIRVAARALRDAIKYWFRMSPSRWAPEFAAFVDEFRRDAERGERDLIEAVELARWGIERYYGQLPIGDGETFERKYIYGVKARGPLSLLKEKNFDPALEFYQSFSGDMLTLGKLLK